MMPELTCLYQLMACLPVDGMEMRFMQRALVALLLLAPMAAMMGVQVVNFRMAFLSDAISHSAFAGVAVGLLAGVSPLLAMPLFGVLMGMGIMALRRSSSLPSDTVIGVFFSLIMAFGLAVVSRDASVGRNLQQYLYGDILTVTDGDIWRMLGLFALLLLFQAWAFNRLLQTGLNAVVAKAHGVPVAFCQYAYAALLALVVMMSVWSVGVFLVTAMLIVPAATARNLARTAGGMFWWALLTALVSAVAGLLLSARPWMGTASGATVVLVAGVCFALSALWAWLRKA